jgi:uncharacterized damage-inducible protein DinB
MEIGKGKMVGLGPSFEFRVSVAPIFYFPFSIFQARMEIGKGKMVGLGPSFEFRVSVAPIFYFPFSIFQARMGSMSEAKRIADQLRRAFHGQAWHGPAVLELLKDVTAQQAAARPLAAAHSIWELALHIGAWERTARRWLAGEIAELPHLAGDDDWPPVRDASDAAWKQTLESLAAEHERLGQLAGQLSDLQLTEKVAGREYSVYFLLHGLTQHCLYHAGQIALLKKT